MARSGDALKYWALRQGGSPESQLKSDYLRLKLVMQRKRTQAERSDVQPQVDAGHSAPDMSWADNLPPCPVYYPTKKEFEEPLDYIQSISPEASKYGICKIVSPIVPSVSAGHVLTREKSGFKFTPRVQPMRFSNWDSTDMHKFLMSGQQYTFHEYEKMANKFYTRRFSSTGCLSPKFVEAEFWKELANGKINVEYGCDIEGSAFSSSAKDPLGRSKWNLNHLPHLAGSTLRLLETAIPGVTEPMLYIGMAFAMFAWHVEDHYLFSVNYHHCGAPKTWYGVPGHAAPDFEDVVRDHVYQKELLADGQGGLAYDLLIGKTTMFSPKLLVEHGVPTYRAIQSPGEFIITFPRGYHAGFSHGFNCSEAVNFAMGDWLQFGAAACRRYELLNRIPLLPHEELLCKEAMDVAASCAAISSRGNQNAAIISDNAVKRQQSVKVAFVLFMRFQHQVRWLLQRRGAQSIFRSPGFDGSVMCCLCKHMCYLAFVTCRCSTTPMCLNHAKEIRQCDCGAGRSVVLREGLPELEQTALRFQEEEGVMRAASRGPSVDIATTLVGITMEESMLDSDDYKLYPHFGDQLGSGKLSSVSTQAVGSNGSIEERKGSGTSEAATLQSASRSSLSAVLRGGHSSSSSTVSGLQSKPRELIDDGSSTLCNGGRGSGSGFETCHWSKEFDRVRERAHSGKVHLPASAKRKRSFTITRKATSGGKVLLTARGASVEDRQSLSRISDDEEDEDDDEDYWPS